MAKLRPATLKDLSILVRHRRGMLEDMGRYPLEHFDQHDRDYEPWARERMLSGLLIGFVIEETGRIVASGCLWLKERQPVPGYAGGRVPYLMSLFTERDCRRRGHAEAILCAAMAWTRERGYPLLTLHASEMGRGLYAKYGFAAGNEMQLRFVAQTPSLTVQAEHGQTPPA